MNDEQQMRFVYRISSLLCKYIRRDITDDELIDLYNWAYANDANRELFEELSDLGTLYASLDFFLEIDPAGKLRQTLDNLSPLEGIGI
jgi:hypothetical protein